MDQTRYKHYDRRTMDRYREKGILSEADVKKFLTSLPDDAANAQYVQMDLHDAEMGAELEDETHSSSDEDESESA